MRNWIILGLLTGVVACSNSGSNGNAEGILPNQVPGAISGTAAVGAPMVNARVKVEGPACTGNLAKFADANSNGVYSVRLDGCEGPFFITAESSIGRIFSVATQEDVGSIVNVTPLTQVVAARVLGLNNFENIDLSVELTNITKAKVDQSVTDIQTALSGLTSSFGATGINIRSGAFAANGSKLDKVLDAVSVQTSSSDFQISIKGSNASVTIPSDSAIPVTDVFDPADVTSANESMVEFDSMKSVMIAGINACLKLKSKACYSAFFHPDYMNDGLDVDGEWDDIYWPGMDLSYVNLTLISMNETKNEAWVAYTTREKDDDGKYRGWLGVNKLKKESSVWQIYGNQIDQKFRPQAGIIQDGALGNLKRGINFRYWDWRAITDGFTFEFTSGDLGLSGPVNVTYSGFTGSTEQDGPVDSDGLVYFNVQSGTPTCANNNKHCKNFLVLNTSKSILFPRYEITYGGKTYESYMTGLPSLPANRDEIPKFTNLDHNTVLCQPYTSVAAFPNATLNWTLPNKFKNEEILFNNKGNNYSNWDFDYDLGYDETSRDLRAGIIPTNPSGEFEITKIQLRLELRDDKDRSYFLPYSCSNP